MCRCLRHHRWRYPDGGVRSAEESQRELEAAVRSGGGRFGAVPLRFGHDRGDLLKTEEHGTEKVKEASGTAPPEGTTAAGRGTAAHSCHQRPPSAASSIRAAAAVRASCSRTSHQGTADY